MTALISQVTDPSICYDLRHTVFVDEQDVPVEAERDELDAEAIHLLATVNGTPTGAARVVLMGDTGKIGRVCVLKEARGTGQGIGLIEAALTILRETDGMTRAALGARVDAMGFYEKLGFRAYGDVFDDVGIDHQMMEINLGE